MITRNVIGRVILVSPIKLKHRHVANVVRARQICKPTRLLNCENPLGNQQMLKCLFEQEEQPRLSENIFLISWMFCTNFLCTHR